MLGVIFWSYSYVGLLHFTVYWEIWKNNIAAKLPNHCSMSAGELSIGDIRKMLFNNVVIWLQRKQSIFRINGAVLLPLPWPPPQHNCFTDLFPGPPGWARARRELLDFVVQGKINRGRHTDHPAGCHSIRTNQRLPPPFPHIFFTGRMPFLPPNQQRQSTEGN